MDTGGAEGNRTPGLIIANDALYQLSYGPTGALFGPAAWGCQAPVAGIRCKLAARVCLPLCGRSGAASPRRFPFVSRMTSSRTPAGPEDISIFPQGKTGMGNISLRLSQGSHGMGGHTRQTALQDTASCGTGARPSCLSVSRARYPPTRLRPRGCHIPPACRAQSASWAAGRAPERRAASRPSRNRIKAGMPRMFQRTVASG